jgi:Zn-dependent protease with chaperone function
MRFRQHQAQAHAQTFRLFAWFAVLLVVLLGAVNLLLALAYKLLVPLGSGFPPLFFETNSGLVLLFVLGGCLVETQRLREGGGPRIAHWLSGREVISPDNGLEKRLLNVVDEMALASGQAVPAVYVLHREDAINAFVAGWAPEDTVLCVTRGALERLNRAELQGLVAHEFGHIKEGDLPLSMRLLALVWGLSLIHGYGQSLMEADDKGSVNPGAWVIGLVFSGVGWLGWLAGQALQAAVSRQREFLADASAIQFTRSRDGLGNVLRKLWHDQQVLAGRMRSPASGMIASLLMHQPAGTTCLATHPRLSERIRRICGAVLPPLPAPLIRLDATEPRRTPLPPEHGLPMVAANAINALAPAGAPVLGQSETGVPLATLRGDQDALARLQRLSGPTERRLAVLALMMNPDNPREQKLWARLAEGLALSKQIMDDVATLQPVRRVPEFERLTAALASAPIEERRTLVEAARDLMRADGRVSPIDRLWWLALRRRVSDLAAKPALMRPITGQGQTLSQLEPAAHQPVAALSAYLARFVPLTETGRGLNDASRAWLAAVYRRCGIAVERATDAPPDADGLVLALTQVQELSWMMRPMLIKAWVEEAVNHSPQGILSDNTADALRLAAGLIDSPLPPMLEAHYPRT